LNISLNRRIWESCPLPCHERGRTQGFIRAKEPEARACCQRNRALANKLSETAFQIRSWSVCRIRRRASDRQNSGSAHSSRASIHTGVRSPEDTVSLRRFRGSRSMPGLREMLGSTVHTAPDKRTGGTLSNRQIAVAITAASSISSAPLPRRQHRTSRGQRNLSHASRGADQYLDPLNPQTDKEFVTDGRGPRWRKAGNRAECRPFWHTAVGNMPTRGVGFVTRIDYYYGTIDTS
jgi:hypothetical protein